MSYASRGGIGIAPVLYRFVNEECLTGIKVGAESFWTGLGTLIRELTPVNGSLLATRDRSSRTSPVRSSSCHWTMRDTR